MTVKSTIDGVERRRVDLLLRALRAWPAQAGNASSKQDGGDVLRRLFGRDVTSDEKSEIDERKLSRLAATHCRADRLDCGACPFVRVCAHGRGTIGKSVHKANKKHIPFADLFCGAGGLSLGLEAHDFRPEIAVDNDSAACQTYLFNRPWLDVDAVRNESLAEILNGRVKKTPIVVGGPPCQGFSNANRQRLSLDPRNGLYRDFIQFIERSGAAICVMENVPGMLGAAPQIEADFEQIGFSGKAVVVDAQDFGYPQRRRRLFWLGIRSSAFRQADAALDLFEQSLIGQPVGKPFFLSHSISDLPRLEAKRQKNATNDESEKSGFTVSFAARKNTRFTRLINGERGGVGFLFNHRTKYNNDRDIEIYGTLMPGEDSQAESIRRIMPYKDRRKIFKDKFFKLEPNRPCKTITAHMYYDCHMYIHPSQARGITPREAARVQGFPDDYIFLGYPNQWYRQIGNAVSPLLSWQIGRALRNVVEFLGMKV